MTASGFWGLLVEPGKMYSQTVPATFKVTMASLGPDVDEKNAVRTTVMLRIEDQDDYALCSLSAGKLEQQPLELVLKEGETIAFRVSGNCPVHLTGYFVEADHCHDDEEEDDFIDDEEAEEVDGEYDSEEEEDFDAEEARATVKKIMKSKRARKGIVEDSEDDSASELVEDSDDEGESIGSEDFTDEEDDEDEDEEIDSDEIDTDDMEDMSEVDFDSEDMSEDSEEESESEEEIVPKGKRTNAPSPKKTEQPEVKKPKTSNAPVKKESTPAKANEPAKTATPQPDAAAPKKADNEQGRKTEAAPTKKQPESPAPSQTDSAKKQNVKTLPSGLMIEDIKAGTEGAPKATKGRKVSISYVGKLTNGKTFDQNPKGDFSFIIGANEVIKGMDIGIQGMALGGKRRLTIPAALAYGNKALPGIPANSTLVFEITLHHVKTK